MGRILTVLKFLGKVLPTVLGVALIVLGVQTDAMFPTAIGLWIISIEAVLRKMDALEQCLQLTLRFHVERSIFELANDHPFFKEMLEARARNQQEAAKE